MAEGKVRADRGVTESLLHTGVAGAVMVAVYLMAGVVGDVVVGAIRYASG